MTVSCSDVEKIAQLARLSFSQTEIETLQKELSNILQFVEQIDSADTGDISPMEHSKITETILREDIANPNILLNAQLSQAPLAENNLFLVPTVIE